ncbi:Ku protein [Nitrosomonas sp. Nm166]|uniref:Ku protein n=1 Tax=Nitrosomonas sp. Nm166 TaxID=1881054 RepID=UPI0008EA77B3|nr:Ku protein [Nitrosomonas sp. Nm166]SFF20944.1 Ku70/Ku80 beta-barrel domain-containing protein [Nitrosomonas sp. Nm166]
MVKDKLLQGSEYASARLLERTYQVVPCHLSGLSLSSRDRERKNPLHKYDKDTGQRIHYQNVNENGDVVEADDIVKGYEYEKGAFIPIEDKEIEKLRLESKHTIDLVHFAWPVTWTELKKYKKASAITLKNIDAKLLKNAEKISAEFLEASQKLKT